MKQKMDCQSHKKNNSLYPSDFDTTYKSYGKCDEIRLPQSHEDVLSIILELRKQHKTFQVISTGSNLGYGGKIPAQDSDVLIDLRSLQNIEVDKENCVVKIGAGVTQQILFEHLVDNDIELSFHITGAPAQTSIVGNAITGGYANGVNSIRFDRIISVKGVYFNGCEFCTHQSSNTKYMDGPDLRGFLKGGLNGIITEIKYELDVIPHFMNIIFFSVDIDENIGAVLKECDYLRKNGVVHSNISIFNSYRIYAESAGHYNSKISGHQYDFKNYIYEYLRSNDLDFWSGEISGVLANYFADRSILEVTESYIKQRLTTHLTKYFSVTITRADILRLRKNPLCKLPKGAHPTMRGRILTFSGIPMHGSVSMGYWRKNSVDLESMDLEKDKCGFIWLAISTNPDGEKIFNLINGLERIVITYNFEPFFVLDYVRPHESYLMWSIIYDRNKSGDDEKAKACHKECVRFIDANGATLYRKPRNLD
jgi:4-cresol dehydrogenase (hydroxylating)